MARGRPPGKGNKRKSSFSNSDARRKRQER